MIKNKVRAQHIVAMHAVSAAAVEGFNFSKFIALNIKN